MNLLDPFEVAEIRVWPLDLQKLEKHQALELLTQAEYTVYQKLLRESKLNAVLNEKPPPKTALFKLPKDYRGRIIPDDIYPVRKHPTFVSLDVRIRLQVWRASSVNSKFLRDFAEHYYLRLEGLRNLLVSV